MTSWRTKLDHPEIPHGHELHGVFLDPIGDEGGPRSTVCLQIPEATTVEIEHAFTTAARFQMRVVIITDTAQQAADFAQLAATKLPLHKRVALERAEAGAIGRVV
jgi:hypothetical protein